MTFKNVSLLSKLRTTASVMRSGLLREPIHQGCALKSEYTSKTKEANPAEINNSNRIKHCKQFTTISKMLHGRTDMSSKTLTNKINVIGLEAIGITTVNSLVNQLISDNICLVDIDDALNRQLLDLKMGAISKGNAKEVDSRDSKEKLLLPVKLEEQVEPIGNKVSVVGIGSVGMAAAFSMLTQGVTNHIALVDMSENKLKGQVLDLNHGSKFLPNCKIEGSTDYSITAGSAICVVTAGVRQRVGETRLELVGKNTKLFQSIIPQLTKYSPNTIFLIASNPVDILTYVTWKISKLPMNRVIGSGCNLDSSRFVYLLSQKFGVAPRSCHGYIIGEHGDSSVPVWSGVNIAGVRLADLNKFLGEDGDPENWKEVHKKVVNGGLDVIRLKGYTSWAIGLSIAQIVRSVLDDDNSIQTVSTHVKEIHGIEQDVFLSLPCVIGRNGVLAIVNQRLTDQERALLQRSAKTIHEVQSGLKI